MSVSVKKYPTAYTDPDGLWTLPNNALNVEDGLCAHVFTTLSLSDIYLSTYGFALPPTAIIDHEYINHKGVYARGGPNPALNSLVFYAQKNGGGTTYSDFSSPYLAAGVCANTAYAFEYEMLSFFPLPPHPPWTVNDLNAENFVTWVEAYSAVDPFRVSHYLDAAYIRVVYHLPAVKKGLMDGLIFVS